jgi:hypothetical protein
VRQIDMAVEHLGRFAAQFPRGPEYIELEGARAGFDFWLHNSFGRRERQALAGPLSAAFEMEPQFSILHDLFQIARRLLSLPASEASVERGPVVSEARSLPSVVPVERGAAAQPQPHDGGWFARHAGGPFRDSSPAPCAVSPSPYSR